MNKKVIVMIGILLLLITGVSAYLILQESRPEDLVIPDDHLAPYQETVFWSVIDKDEDYYEFKAWYKGEIVEILDDFDKDDIFFPISVIDQDKIAYYQISFGGMALKDDNYIHDLREDHREPIEIIRNEDDSDAYNEFFFIDENTFYVSTTEHLPDYENPETIESYIYYVSDNEKQKVFTSSITASENWKEEYEFKFTISPDKNMIAIHTTKVLDDQNEYDPITLYAVKDGNIAEELSEIDNVISYDWMNENEIIYSTEDKVYIYNIESESSKEVEGLDDIEGKSNLKYNRVTGLLSLSDLENKQTVILDTRRASIVKTIENRYAIEWVGREKLFMNKIEKSAEGVSNKGLTIIDVETDDEVNLSDKAGRAGYYR